MTLYSDSYYRELQRRVRALLEAVASQIPVAEVAFMSELIDANESGVALEMMSEALSELSATVPPDFLRDYDGLVRAIGLDEKNVDRLRVLASEEGENVP